MSSQVELIEDPVSFRVKALPIRQPMGDFLIASIPARRLCEIAYFDVRRMLRERDIETYLGIQRPLNPDRVKALESYVRTADACFPTAVILAIEGRCADFDADTGYLTLSNDPAPQDGAEPIHYRNIARVLDGQHRIAGLIGYERDDFEVNVSIFLDIELQDQAYIFSTVNLAQTKVSRSLAYDLFELAKLPSPQKTCHNVAVALDQVAKSPLHMRIKRLGTATAGRSGELLTQATVVQSLMPFVSGDPMIDRDLLLRGAKLSLPSEMELRRHPFRRFFVEREDAKIFNILMNYFSAVRDRWPVAWNSTERGMVLNRTNGFRALMRALLPLYRTLSTRAEVPTEQAFKQQLDRIDVDESAFHVDRFKPGSSGEGDLFRLLMQGFGLALPQ